MHTISFTKLFALGLLVTAPLASAYVDVDAPAAEGLSIKRFVVRQ